MITTLRLKLLIVKQTPAFQHLREGIENNMENMIAKRLVFIYVEARWGGGEGERGEGPGYFRLARGGGGYLTFYKEV